MRVQLLESVYVLFRGTGCIVRLLIMCFRVQRATAISRTCFLPAAMAFLEALHGLLIALLQVRAAGLTL